MVAFDSCFLFPLLSPWLDLKHFKARFDSFYFQLDLCAIEGRWRLFMCKSKQTIPEMYVLINTFTPNFSVRNQIRFACT